jgi:hypothetical protein
VNGAIERRRHNPLAKDRHQGQGIAMDELQRAAWEYVAGRMFPEDLPMVAAQALADGADSPALCELAALSRRSDPREIRELFASALADLGITLPSHEQAGRRDLQRLAEDLVAGRRSPRETARICQLSDSWMNEAESDFVAWCCDFGDIVDEMPAERVPGLGAERMNFAHAAFKRSQAQVQRVRLSASVVPAACPYGAATAVNHGYSRPAGYGDAPPRSCSG